MTTSHLYGCITTHRGGFLYQHKRRSKTRPLVLRHILPLNGVRMFNCPSAFLLGLVGRTCGDACGLDRCATASVYGTQRLTLSVSRTWQGCRTRPVCSPFSVRLTEMYETRKYGRREKRICFRLSGVAKSRVTSRYATSLSLLPRTVACQPAISPA